jgi:hypothetical protein
VALWPQRARSSLLEILASFIVERLAGILPQFIARRLVSPDSVRHELSIDYRGQNPVDLQLGRSVPLLRIWLEIDNRSRVHVVFDRALVEVWVGQPMLNGSILTRSTINSRDKFEDLAFEAFLSQAQVAEFQHHQQNPPQHRPPLRLHIRSFYESPVGWIEVIDVAERDLPG